MARLLLIANSTARGVTGYKREVISRALSAEFAVEVAETKQPGHATELARRAVTEAVDVVVALGGDGTINEVANGLAETATPMAILPGGGVNVFARSLGIPQDAVEATGRLLDRLGDPPRRIPLGRADGRFFTSSCGVGLDAAIVRRVERRQMLKRTGGDLFYVWTGLRTFFFAYGRRKPKLQVSWGPGLAERREGLHLAIAQNTDPYVYWGERRLRLCPDASLEDEGVDCFALDTMRTRTVLRVLLQAFGSARHVRSRHVLTLHDQPLLVVESERPLGVQVDGEYLGERRRLVIESVPRALSIIA